MKKLAIIVIILFAVQTSYSIEENVYAPSNAEDFTKIGADGGQFLKIGVGARGTGMASAFSAITDDLSALHFNPAGINGIDGVSAEFSHTLWFGGFSHNFAAVTTPISSDYRIAVSFVNFTSGEIEETTMLRDDGTGSFYSVDDIAAQLTFAGRLTEQFTFGITAKYVQLAFHDVSSSGLAIDIGTQYDTDIEGIKFGFSVHNLGTDHKYQGEGLKFRDEQDFVNALPTDAEYMAYPFSLPLMFRIGLGKELYEDDMHKFVGAFDFITSSDVPEQFAFGAEYEWNQFLYVRAGYLLNHDQLNLSWGLGLKYLSGGFEGKIGYSMNPTSDIGIINRINAGVSF